MYTYIYEIWGRTAWSSHGGVRTRPCLKFRALELAGPSFLPPPSLCHVQSAHQTIHTPDTCPCPAGQNAVRCGGERESRVALQEPCPVPGARIFSVENLVAR